MGSRNPTPQGEANAQHFARALANAGLTIVSGLALGVDGMAHSGALASTAAQTVRTIAVVGTGLDRVYPSRHRALAHQISQQGLLLSEYPLGTPPLAANFPRRNRIISGLCVGTLVVEATLQSGSLITAQLAVDEGKDVFAIPGSIHSVQSRGCHALIRQGAKLVDCVEDVLSELQLAPASIQMANPDSACATVSAATPAPDSALLQALGFEPADLDSLQQRTGLPTALLQADLMQLELDGAVARLPGGRFQRLGAH